MLSYRHAYHAGNHADVVKHTLLIHCLDYLLQKEKPILYVDTHSGAASYDLNAPEARMNCEHLSGIAALLTQTALPPLLQRTKEVIQSITAPESPDKIYPGSPAIAARLLRNHDQLRLHELHPADFRLLGDRMRDDPRVTCLRKDGFAGLIKSFPPVSRRALALIDPSYETERDYLAVPLAIDDALLKFASAVILVWYPLLQAGRHLQLKQHLKTVSAGNWLNFEFQKLPDGPGLMGSGMWVINPPWNLPTTLKEGQEQLPILLGNPDVSTVSLTWEIP